MRIRNKKSYKKHIIILAVIVIVLGTIGAITVYALTSNSAEENSQQKETATEDSFGTVDYSPSTDVDKKYNDSIKENLDAKDDTPTQGEKTRVTPVIVDAGQYDGMVEVRSIVEKITENGTCTFIFTRGNASFTKETQAIPDASSTRCANLMIAPTEFSSKGTWSVAVTYDSAKATGKSTGKEFTVQ